MYRFLETIRVEGRRPQNLCYHQQRMVATFGKFFPGLKTPVLKEIISIPESLGPGIYKCRIVYGRNVEEMKFEPYNEKMIATLKLVDAAHLDYSFKFADRSEINKLTELGQSCDDILIIKDGRITDTSYGNILFYDGNVWVTPDKPLLAGTRRRKLLDEGKIKATSVGLAELSSFKKFMLVNAMLDFDELRGKDISGIIR